MTNERLSYGWHAATPRRTDGNPMFVTVIHRIHDEYYEMRVDGLTPQLGR